MKQYDIMAQLDWIDEATILNGTLNFEAASLIESLLLIVLLGPGVLLCLKLMTIMSSDPSDQIAAGSCESHPKKTGGYLELLNHQCPKLSQSFANG